MKICRFLVWGLLSLLPGLVASQHCSPSDNESVLQINNAYTYRYRSVAVAQAVGTTEDRGTIILECDVHISHDRTCYYHLKLQGCMLTASGGEPGSETAWMDREPLPDLSRHHLTFSLTNGEVEDVKTHEDDPVYYVNIKRGVLSAFVFKLSQTKNDMKEMHTDIHGTCPMTSVPDKEVNGDVRTSKDMLHCNFPSRPDWQFSPWSMFWNMSFIQHVINSTTDCNYKISSEEKRIETVFCRERHAIMLESTHRTTTAVQTNIYYSMEFVKSNVQNSKPAFAALTRKTDIRYEYDHTPVPQSSPPDFLQVAVKMLSDLVLDSVDEIRLFTIPQFTEFVAWIRASHDLTNLVDKVKYCEFLPDGTQCDDKMKELALSYLSDALVQCNNLPCAKAIAYLAKNDDLSPIYLNFIYQSWSYMHYSKPGFLTNFVDICKAKDSRQCWVSAAAFARRIYSRNILDEKVLQEVRDLASHFHNLIEEDCEVTDDADNSHYTNCLIFLKAASNLGKHYSKLVPDGISRFLEHATNDHSPTFVRASALESIQEVHDPDSKEQNREIYDELLPLLKNVTLSPTLRILSYDRLLPLAEENLHLVEHLLGILRDEKNPELRFYVAESLNTLLKDHQIKSKKEKFLDSVVELLNENGISLEGIMYQTKAKSSKSSYSAFLNFDFMPESMKRFGLKVAESSLYDSYIYPTILNQETILQLFSTFMQTNKLGSYFEGWEELLLAYKKNLADMNSHPASFSKIYEAVVQTLEEYGSKEQNEDVHFDGDIIANIRKIHRLYWKHHKKLNPYAKAYLDLFGSTVKYMVQDSFQQASVNKDLAKLLRFLQKDLEDGATYNTTRVVRVIEAYHQVPTMMGLPLNWTTNATLAFSLRAGLKYQYNFKDDQIHSKGFFQPSAALTFLNRMVLDFPTLTQIGIQANSSAYTSTELKLQYTSSKGKQSFRLERPSRTQKVLELFRTNQFIKHNSYIDIPDWDIERTSSSWCTCDSTNSMAGLKFCLSKSYPNVTHQMKPWALMAGWCKWQFLAHPLDQTEMHYDIQFQQNQKQRSNEYTAKLSATEREKERAVHLNAVLDDGGRAEFKTSMLPDFKASFSRSELTRNKKVSGQRIEALLQIFKDFKYEIEYTNEGKVQKTPMSSTEASTPPDSSTQTQVNEEQFSLMSPYATYRYNKTVQKQGENIKAEATVRYENLNSKSNWLRMILPPSFWEDDKRASVSVFLKWKAPMHQAEDTTTRQTEFKLVIPHYTMTLLGDSLTMKNREQVNVNVAKMNTKLGKLETFLNFTYDVWQNENEGDNKKVIRLVNVTIPRKSWSATYQNTQEGMKYKHEVKLQRNWMKPNQDQHSDYVGWWNNEVSDHFRIEEKEVKLAVDFEMLLLNNEALLNKYPDTLTHEEMLGLGSSVIVSNVVLQYPFSDRVETVILDGYFIMSRGMTTFRFQKTFDLTSSYNNLQLTSHSVYRADSNATRLQHHSYFTHLPSQTKAYNTINYTRVEPEGGCHQYFFKHDIRSHVFDLSTDATYKCEADNLDLYTLLLTLNTNSSKWDMLNMKLNQIVQAVSPDYTREDMTTIHPLGTLHVDAEWHGKKRRREHQKRVVACSKKGNCPNAELFLETYPDGRVNVKLSWPNQNESQLTYERLMSRDHKNLQIKLGHSNKESNFTEFLDFTGEIIAKNFHVWKGMVNVDTYTKVKELVMPAFDSVRDTVIAVAKDKNHPLNEMLQPALKMTLYDYWGGVKTEVKEFLADSWSEIGELLHIVKTFADPAYDALSNTAVGMCDLFKKGYNAIKDKSVTIWAIHYFDLPYYFKQGFMHLPQGISELMQQLTLQEKSLLHFKFITGKFLSLTSFREWPSISFYPSWLSNLVYPSTRNVAPLTTQMGKGEKLAMIFGPLHIWTFDGRLYDVPKYPNEDCAFLLAHDVHKSLFTVFSTQRRLHIVFPEMSVSIDDQNEVFINGSQKAISLPIQASNGKVTVKREHIIEVWSPSLTVICSYRHFLCLLKLRDFHTGGVIGLLGNADGYIDNEFMLPSGNTTSNILEYVSIYEISGKPECKNLVSSPKLSSSNEQKDTCSDAFGDVCYSHYMIRQRFLEACTSDVQVGHGPCYAAAGLSALCHFKHSPSYTRCNIKRQASERVGRNLEVVLVVQESKYLTSPDQTNAPLKGIESLVRALDEKFRGNGYDTVLYSLVGFGGNGVHLDPTVHTARKDIWLTADDMVNDVLKTLEFRSKEDSDSVAALKYALDKLGYDSFDSKVIIVITNKDRQVAEKSFTDAIQGQLEDNGITLYTLSSYPSIEKGKKVYGVRADGLMFPSPKDADAYLDYPRGSLAKLTSSTRGSLFLLKFLRDNKPSAFFEEIAQEVWAKVNKEAQKCRSCRPTRGDWWWYRNECTIGKC